MRRRCAVAAAALAGACAASPHALPPEPTATTEWHAEPVFATATAQNIVVHDHAGPITALLVDWIAQIGQTQYDFLLDYVGAGPEWVHVHVGANYPYGFAIASRPFPEMFLEARGILDTSNNWAHEMTHCFNSYFGELPHWFNESLADVVYADSEIELYQRVSEAEMLKRFDRVDNRSYELMQLRARYGRQYFRKVYRAMLARLAESRRVLRSDEALEDRNRFILSVLSEAAGENLAPVFETEFGFNVRTRERQRGY